MKVLESVMGEEQWQQRVLLVFCDDSAWCRKQVSILFHFFHLFFLFFYFVLFCFVNSCFLLFYLRFVLPTTLWRLAQPQLETCMHTVLRSCMHTLLHICMRTLLGICMHALLHTVCFGLTGKKGCCFCLFEKKKGLFLPF